MSLWYLLPVFQNNRINRIICILGKELRDTDENRKEQFLSDYRIQDEGNLVLVLRLRGGSDQQGQTNGNDTGTVEIVDSDTVETTEDLSPPLKVLGPDVELTSEPDMITFDDDKDGLRAKMPCGHAIGKMKLSTFSKSYNELTSKYHDAVQKKKIKTKSKHK